MELRYNFMKSAIFSALAITSTLLPSEAIAQNSPDITGRWMLERTSDGYEQIIEFEETPTGLQVWQSTPGSPVANEVMRSGNRIGFDWSCRGNCAMEGEIFEDGVSGVLEWTAQSEPGRPAPSPVTYQMTKITEEYCSLTGVWNYYSESDFIYNSNSGFSEGGPPYRATVNITEDEEKNLTISGFYNMSSGDGTGTRQLNSIEGMMPLVAGEGQVFARVSNDDREMTGVIDLREERYQSFASIPFTMTRQTECGDDGDDSPSPGDVIEDVLDVIF